MEDKYRNKITEKWKSIYKEKFTLTNLQGDWGSRVI